MVIAMLLLKKVILHQCSKNDFKYNRGFNTQINLKFECNTSIHTLYGHLLSHKNSSHTDDIEEESSIRWYTDGMKGTFIKNRIR